jgi:hypothetical protein
VTVRHRRQAEAWHEYLAAAQRLHAWYGPGSSCDDAGPAQAELAELRADLARQRARLGVRARWAVSAPELAQARAGLTDDPASIQRALRRCRQLIRIADLQLAGGPRHTGRGRWSWPPTAVRALLRAVSLTLLLALG